ncbi:Putative WD40/YVTN repeat-like-containing domain superfamily [Septoria linicola]|uniref:WD40/YVTN repeat-like-containing domain superfamily n=1 Tax=Septoria linicola TaxID=215465 RepID=A0A9Q9EJK0_9PEZI|nr:Putative WD40/YVTN repeat-like-containing domain superfamily [Septoria linicola]
MSKSLLCVSALVALATTQATFVKGDPARFTYTYMKTPLSGPCDVSEGTDGLIYVQELLANKIARVNQNTGDVKEFDIPFTLGTTPNITLPLPSGARAAFLSCAIRNGFDGKMYFSNGNRNQLVQFDAKTEQVRVFTPSNLLQTIGNLQPLNDLTTAPDGVYFTQTTMNSIAKFDYKTQKFTFFPIPTLLALPLGIYYAQDGGIWFLEFAMNKVGRLDRQTGRIKEYQIPLAGAGPVVIRGETLDPNGDYLLWFPSVIGGALCSINQRTGEILVYPENVASNAEQVAQDYSGNLWISHVVQNTLGVFNPKYKNFTEVIMPGTIVPGPVGLPVYGGTGIYCKPVGNPFTRGTGNAIWFTQLTANRLVRYDLDGLVY